jgi:Ser/Thr protein kinase RdoA (MazF antagonist)
LANDRAGRTSGGAETWCAGIEGCFVSGLYQDDFVESLRRELSAGLYRWGLSASTRLSLLSISENATFRADDPQRDEPVVLRVHRPGYHSIAEIESELAWISALREKSVVLTPRPLPTRDGSLIVAFEHEGSSRQAVAFEFMPGQELDGSTDLRGDFRRLGAITARLHEHSRHWSRPAGFTRKTWDFDSMLGTRAHWGDWREALGLTQQGRSILQRCVELLREQLKDYGQGADRFGLVHADLRLANLLRDGERLAVIDFDDCGFSWYMYDFAAAVSYIETSPEMGKLRSAWLEGYRDVAPLTQEDENALPMFVMLRRLLLTAWIASHAETPTAQELGSGFTDATVDLARDYLARVD